MRSVEKSYTSTIQTRRPVGQENHPLTLLKPWKPSRGKNRPADGFASVEFTD